MLDVYRKLGFVDTYDVQEEEGIRYIPMCRTL
ncbi:GNAT family N-acetyltransferase [Clostridium sp.]